MTGRTQYVHIKHHHILCDLDDKWLKNHQRNEQYQDRSNAALGQRMQTLIMDAAKQEYYTNKEKIKSGAIVPELLE